MRASPKWVKFSTGPRPKRSRWPGRRVRMIHRAIIDTPRPTVTSQAISAARLSAAWLGGRDGGAAIGAWPDDRDCGDVPTGWLDAGMARIRPATYRLSRAMTWRWRTFPDTPAVAARSARLTASFTSTWLRPWQAAGMAVTAT